MEFETDTDTGGEYDSVTEPDDHQSGYHTEDMDQIIADEFARAAVFTYDSDEAAMMV
jgi:hypothetical protein